MGRASLFCGGALVIGFAGQAAAAVSSTRAAPSETKIYQVAELDRAPKARSQAKPLYPADVVEDHTVATVDVAFVIDSHGNVLGARTRGCTVTTVNHSIDFDAAAQGTDSETHASAVSASDYSTLLAAAKQFADSATQAVSKWKFWPGQKAGQSVNAVMAVTIKFVHKLAYHGDDTYSTSNPGDRLRANNGFIALPNRAEEHLVYIPKL